MREAWESGESRSLELQLPDPEVPLVSSLFLPLRTRDRVIGVLEAYGQKTLLDTNSTETLATIASQGASALENARLYDELAQRKRELHHLVGQMVVAQEEERRRVAYELHDGLTQLAIAAHHRLEMFAEDHPPASAEGSQEIEEVIRLCRRAIGESRRLIANLRPTTLDDFGLATAIRLEVEELRAAGFEASYDVAVGEERLPVMLETTVFRVVQEALNNVRKHAGTDRVRVAVGRLDGAVRLEVRGWGRGFDPTQANKGGSRPGERMGLSSMRERVGLLGGNLELRSEPGTGTWVIAEIPLPMAGEEVGRER
jgi:signal transduction histidine kinase